MANNTPENIEYITSMVEYLEVINTCNCVVKFSSSWCNPCKKIQPFYKELSQQYKGKVRFLEVNIDICPEIADYEKVESIPLFLFFKKGLKLNNLEVRGSNPSLLTKNVENFVSIVSEQKVESCNITEEGSSGACSTSSEEESNLETSSSDEV